MNEITISFLTMRHINEISMIHMAAFPNRALTSLGKEAVAYYYETLLNNSKFCLCAGAFSGPKLVGYLIGGEMNGLMRNYLRDHFGFLLFRVLTRPWLLVRPLMRERVRLAFTVLKKKPRGSKSKRDQGIKTFSVLVIAVAPSVQLKGVGKMLMSCAERTAVEHNYTRMRLSVDRQNTQAIRFYERLEWTKDRGGDWRGSMLKWL